MRVMLVTGVKQARLEASKKISDYFSSSSPSPTKTRAAEVQTDLTITALSTLEGKASKSERITTLEQVRKQFSHVIFM